MRNILVFALTAACGGSPEEFTETRSSENKGGKGEERSAKTELVVHEVPACVPENGFCTRRVDLGGREIADLSAGEEHLVFESNGAIFAHALATGETKAILTPEAAEHPWTSPSLGGSLIAAKRLLPDGLEYRVVSLRGESVASRVIPEERGAHRRDFAVTQFEVRGPYLAWMEPAERYGSWKIFVGRIDAENGEISEVLLGEGSVWSQFALAEDGKIAAVLVPRSQNQWGRRELALHSPDFDGARPERSESETVYAVDYYYQIANPRMHGARIVFEVIALTSTFNPRIVSAVMLAEGEPLSVWMLTFQGAPTRTRILVGPQAHGDSIAWIDGSLDPFHPALAIRKLSSEDGAPVVTGYRAIYPAKGSAVHEFAFLDEDRLIWTEFGDRDASAYLTSILEYPALE